MAHCWGESTDSLAVPYGMDVLCAVSPPDHRADVVIGTDVLFSDNLIVSLLHSLKQTTHSRWFRCSSANTALILFLCLIDSRRSKVYIANELRDEITHRKFLEEAQRMFRLKRVRCLSCLSIRAASQDWFCSQIPRKKYSSAPSAIEIYLLTHKPQPRITNEPSCINEQRS